MRKLLVLALLIGLTSGPAQAMGAALSSHCGSIEAEWGLCFRGAFTGMGYISAVCTALSFIPGAQGAAAGCGIGAIL